MNTLMASPQSGVHPEHVDTLNRQCFCLTLDQDALSLALDSEVGQPQLSEMIRQRCPLPVRCAARVRAGTPAADDGASGAGGGIGCGASSVSATGLDQRAEHCG